MSLKTIHHRIRAQYNVILVIRSRFGGSLDTKSNTRGIWAIDRGLLSMPVDSIPLGSRVIGAREVRISLAIVSILPM
jgi:enoyl reductase-like protein